MTGRASGVVRLAGLLVILAAAWVAVRATPAREYLTPAGVARLVDAVRATWWTPIAFVAAYVLACVFAFSGAVLTLAGGALFGFWWGSLLNTLGANLGASAAFWVARRLGREGVQGLLGSRLEGLDRLAQRSGFAWLLRLRLIPVVPFNLLNFGSGLTAMPWRDYALATVVGILPGTLVYTFFATALLEGSREASREALLRVVVAGGLLVVLSFVPAIARRFGWLAVAGLALLPGDRLPAQDLPDHGSFTAVLEAHVRGGRVDYAALQQDSARLNFYLARLAAADSQALAAADRSTRLAFSDTELQLNKVLDWYAEDFGGPEGIGTFFARYLSPADGARVTADGARLTFLDYDWTLNDIDR